MVSPIRRLNRFGTSFGLHFTSLEPFEGERKKNQESKPALVLYWNVCIHHRHSLSKIDKKANQNDLRTLNVHLQGMKMKEIDREIEEIKIYRRKFYDNRAGVYDKIWWESPESTEEIDGFRNLVKVKHGEIVLDVATGTGIYLIEMAKKGAQCYGLDASPKMLAQLKRKIEQLELEGNVEEIRVCEADKIPYPNDFFDWVSCIGMLEYYPIEYADMALNEIRRVLKPSKKCFIDIPDPGDKENQNRDYLYKYDLKTFENMLNKIGFDILAKNVAARMIQYLLSKRT